MHLEIFPHLSNINFKKQQPISRLKIMDFASNVLDPLVNRARGRTWTTPPPSSYPHVPNPHLTCSKFSSITCKNATFDPFSNTFLARNGLFPPWKENPFKGSRKKNVFFSGPAAKALPPPLELNGHKKISRIFWELKKNGIFS